MFDMADCWDSLEVVVFLFYKRGGCASDERNRDFGKCEREDENEFSNFRADSSLCNCVALIVQLSNAIKVH